MKIMILGYDGYIGWPLTMTLLKRGHDISGMDNLSRRRLVKKVGAKSASVISGVSHRQSLNENLHLGDVRSPLLHHFLQRYSPDVIFHLAEWPSAPFSMISYSHAVAHHRNNVEGTLNLLHGMKKHCPKAILIKIGTMGEYYQPDLEEMEGELGVIPENSLNYPRRPGSWYHLTKVHDSHNIKFACDTWGLHAIDVMQSPVYGCRVDRITSRLDYDQYFGTVVNRFCVQAKMGMPITIYGSGNQIRGFLSLRDSVGCLLTIAENYNQLFSKDRYIIINQLHERCSIGQLAAKVGSFVEGSKYTYLKNPRVEKESHAYLVEANILHNLGYRFHRTIAEEIPIILSYIMGHRVNKEVIMPTTNWR